MNPLSPRPICQELVESVAVASEVAVLEVNVLLRDGARHDLKNGEMSPKPAQEEVVKKNEGSPRLLPRMLTTALGTLQLT